MRQQSSVLNANWSLDIIQQFARETRHCDCTPNHLDPQGELFELWLGSWLATKH